MKKNLDKFRCCLIGRAAGDALGYAIEFLSESFIFAEFGKEGITDYLLHDSKAWISDDTQMTMFTANGLLFGTTRVCTQGIMGTDPATLQKPTGIGIKPSLNLMPTVTGNLSQAV